MEGYELRFIYDSAALVLSGGQGNVLVVGDMHIGMERRLKDRGVHLYGATEHMAEQIKRIAKENSAKRIVMLGDVKESILRPDSTDVMLIRGFFGGLEGFDVTVARGNHDAYLEDVVRTPIVDEVDIGKFALLHGHMWPSDKAMLKDYIVIAHNHVAISLRDDNGAIYNQKAWLVAEVDAEGAAKRYKKFNKKIKLIVMPAFNDLIVGTPVNMRDDRHINPLFRNGVFDFPNAGVYAISGSLLGTPESLSAKK